MTFSDDLPPQAVVPLEYGVVPSKEKKMDFLVFYPKISGQLTVLSHENEMVEAADRQHGAIEAKFRWSPSPAL